MIKLIVDGTINSDILKNIHGYQYGINIDIQVIDLIGSHLHIGAVWVR